MIINTGSGGCDLLLTFLMWLQFLHPLSRIRSKIMIHNDASMMMIMMLVIMMMMIVMTMSMIIIDNSKTSSSKYAIFNVLSHLCAILFFDVLTVLFFFRATILFFDVLTVVFFLGPLFFWCSTVFFLFRATIFLMFLQFFSF